MAFGGLKKVLFRGFGRVFPFLFTGEDIADGSALIFPLTKIRFPSY